MSTQESGARIHFEEGNHSITHDERRSIEDSIKKGDASANEWNWGVSERISQYKPSMIAIDSIEPVPVDGNDSFKVAVNDKKWIWELLPDGPQRLNGTDKIKVIAGDFMYGEPDLGDFSSKLFLGTSNAILLTAGALGGRVLDTYVKNAREWYRDYDHVSGTYKKDPEAPDISRRNFLSALGLGAALIASRATVLAAYSPWREPQPVLRDIADATKPIVFDGFPNDASTYIRGRTALLISKAMDMSEPDTKDVSVVMGFTHMYGADDLIESTSERKNAIRDLAEIMIDKALNDSTLGDRTPFERKQWVVFSLMAAQIFEVTEPDPERFTHNPMQEIDRSVNFYAQLNSPQVQEATSDLIK